MNIFRKRPKEIIAVINPDQVKVDMLKNIKLKDHVIWYIFAYATNEPIQFYDLDNLGISTKDMEEIRGDPLDEFMETYLQTLKGGN